VPNGQPKLLLNLFLPGYPLVNFAVCTAVYVFVSYRLFFLTNALKNVAIPGKEMGLLWRNGAIMAVSAAVRSWKHQHNTSACDSSQYCYEFILVTWVKKSGRALPVVLKHPLNAGAVCRRSMCPAVWHVVGYLVAGNTGVGIVEQNIVVAGAFGVPI
jgi:hypothetical protein